MPGRAACRARSPAQANTAAKSRFSSWRTLEQLEAPRVSNPRRENPPTGRARVALPSARQTEPTSVRARRWRALPLERAVADAIRQRLRAQGRAQLLRARRVTAEPRIEQLQDVPADR